MDPAISYIYSAKRVGAGSAIVLRIIANWFAWLPGMNLAENPENFNNIAAANGAVLVLMLLGLIAVDWRLGDSGGPLFLGETQVGINTWTSSARCVGPSYAYRLDSPTAQAFLNLYL